MLRSTLMLGSFLVLGMPLVQLGLVIWHNLCGPRPPARQPPIRRRASVRVRVRYSARLACILLAQVARNVPGAVGRARKAAQSVAEDVGYLQGPIPIRQTRPHPNRIRPDVAKRDLPVAELPAGCGQGQCD